MEKLEKSEDFCEISLTLGKRSLLDNLLHFFWFRNLAYFWAEIYACYPLQFSVTFVCNLDKFCCM